MWLGSGQDMGPEVKVPASYMDPRSDRADYTVYVHTSDVKCVTSQPHDTALTACMQQRQIGCKNRHSNPQCTEQLA